MLDRQNKTKERALVDAEIKVEAALAKAARVEELENLLVERGIQLETSQVREFVLLLLRHSTCRLKHALLSPIYIGRHGQASLQFVLHSSRACAGFAGRDEDCGHHVQAEGC